MLLDSLIDRKDMLNSPPIYRQCALLKAQLLKYHDIRDAGGFPVIKSTKKTFSKGDSSETVPIVREWLYIPVRLPVKKGLSVMDESLAAGIKKFQQRIGLKVDGIIGQQCLHK